MDERRLSEAPATPPSRAMSRPPGRPLGLLVLILMALFSVAACGTGLVSSATPPAEPIAPSPQEVARPPSKLTADGLAEGITAGDEMASLRDDLVGQAQPAQGRTGAVDGALIVRWGSLEMEVADVTLALSQARREIGGLGGYVAGSDESDHGEHRWASVSYRVPVARFDAAIEALRGLSARVVREATQSQEVTAQVVDLDARITNLRASEEALVEIMARAGRIDDVLAVQLRLEDVRSQIERLVAQRDGLADQAALATISTTWTTPVPAVQMAQEGWELAEEVDAALAQTVAALQAAASALVWLAVVGLPLLGLPLLLLSTILLLVRRRYAGRTPHLPGDTPAVGGSPAE
jgi:hypothetical protein